MPDVHALLSASGAHRWLECTPSVRLEERFPQTTSVYAEEGTLAHELAEASALYWVGQIDKTEFEKRLAAIKKNKYYTADMQEDCAAYAKLISEKWAKLKEICPDAVVLIEAQIQYGDWAPEGFGTADCLILADGYLEVIDFKYGKGKRVDAFGNPQMRMYTLGAYSTYGLVYQVENITMTIYQPRLSGIISSDEIKIDELLDWGENYVKPRAKLAFNGEGDFKPSNETCKFCKAKNSCKARAEENLKLFDEAPDAFLLTADEAGELLEKAADITDWLNDLKSLVTNTLIKGDSVKGWKMVEGRSNRKFTDTSAVAATLLDSGYTEEVIYKPQALQNLTDLEKMLGKKEFNSLLGDFVIKPHGSPTLAPMSDKRPELKITEKILAGFDEE